MKPLALLVLMQEFHKVRKRPIADLYNIFISDIPTDPNTILATYANDIAILSINNNPITALKTYKNTLSKSKFNQKKKNGKRK